MKKLAIYPLAGAAVVAALVCFGGAQAGATQREISDARNSCSAMIGQVKGMGSYDYWKSTVARAARVALRMSSSMPTTGS